MYKKIFYLSIVLLMGLSLLTGCSKNDEKKKETPSTPEIKYSHKIGDQVTLKDGTIWYVIENSEASSDTVTLFASQNIKNDTSGWTTAKDEYKIAFDEANARKRADNSYCTVSSYGCNIYASNRDTVTEDSSIKKFVDSKVLPYINNSLTGNGGTNINSIRLITVDELCNIINALDSSNNCTLSIANHTSNGEKLTDNYTNVPEWLYSTIYWTMTPYASNPYLVYNVNDYGYFELQIASNDYYIGARPVIVTSKSNIK